MIWCFFDDSGTHDGAQVVVWGGVIGSVEEFDHLEVAWNALLREPLPDKPPLKKFHLFDCRAKMGEFESYSDPESEHLQYLFRCIMVESRLIPVAFGASVASWEVTALCETFSMAQKVPRLGIALSAH